MQPWIKELYLFPFQGKAWKPFVIFLWHCNNFGSCEVLLYAIYDNLFLNNYPQHPQTPYSEIHFCRRTRCVDSWWYLQGSCAPFCELNIAPDGQDSSAAPVIQSSKSSFYLWVHWMCSRTATAALTSGFLKSKWHTKDFLPSQKTTFQMVIAAWARVFSSTVYNLFSLFEKSQFWQNLCSEYLLASAF